MLSARAPRTSLVWMREPSRPLRRSMYSFTMVRTSMKPSVTISTKIRLEMAQKMKVCCGSAGPYLPKLKEPCQTTSATRNRQQDDAAAVEDSLSHLFEL